MKQISELDLNETQKIMKIMSMSHDLSAIETRRKIALSNSQIGIWEWNLMTNKVIWDETMYIIYNADKNFEPTISAILDLMHPDDISMMKDVINKITNDTSILSYSAMFRIKYEEHYKYILSVGKKILNANNQIVKIIGTNQPIESSIFSHYKSNN